MTTLTEPYAHSRCTQNNVNRQTIQISPFRRNQPDQSIMDDDDDDVEKIKFK